MKHLLFATLTFCAMAVSTAQTPVYVLFNNDCMQQLEYKNTSSGESVFAYSYRPNPDEQYIFMSTTAGMPTPNLPEGTFDCNTLSVTDEAVKIINSTPGTRQMYVIIQQSSSRGYLMMPIYSALQIKRYGSWYLLVAPKYTFAIDTTDLNYQKSLQGESSPTAVKFRGTQLSNCRYQYTFRGEPVQGYTESVEFDFIYGIGVVRNRVGSNETEMQQNETRLNSVNGQLFNAYLASICQPISQQYNFDYNTPTWTNPATYNYNNYNEPDKESTSVTNGGWQQPNLHDYTNNTSAPNLSNCPIAPGAGYHVVQPRESLKAIARTYNVDLKSIIKWNNIKNPDHIEVCQQIWLQKPPANAKTTATNYNYNAPTQYTYTAKSVDGPIVQSQSGFWGGGQQQPNTYSTPTQYGFAPKGGSHVVQKNETLFGIAKRYACAEECIRRANNFSLEGNVVIRVGQTLIIPECTCQMQGTTSPPAQQYQTGAAPRTAGVPSQISNALNIQTQQQAPAQSPTVYYDNNNRSFIDTRTAADPARSQVPANEQQNQPPTQEYIVRQGETLNSIAIKFKMSLAELATLNSVGQDDKVPAGKRLVVRRY